VDEAQTGSRATEQKFVAQQIQMQVPDSSDRGSVSEVP